jgi:hypothetical protein
MVRSTAYTAYSVFIHMYKLQHKRNKRYLAEKESQTASKPLID